MNFFFALTWEGAYHDDSELWADNDDGTYAKPALAFIRDVIQPTLRRVLTEWDMGITSTKISNGNKLIELLPETNVLEILQQRENQFDAQIETLGEKESSFREGLELNTASSVVNFTITVEGDCADVSELFAGTELGIKAISKLLMTELARQYMGQMCLFGYSKNGEHFIDYGGSYELGEGGRMPLWPFANPYGGNVEIFNRAHLISGELASQLESLAEQSHPDREQT